MTIRIRIYKLIKDLIKVFKHNLNWKISLFDEIFRFIII